MKTISLLHIALMMLPTQTLASQVHDVLVTRKGFEPSRIETKVGEKVKLKITRKVKITCAKKITVPSEGIEKKLPLNKIVEVEFTPKKKGEMVFGCSMKQMLGGVVVVN